jgi:hypothetical protein
MLFKVFQAFLVTFVVIFTTAGAVLLVSGLLTFLLPSNGVFALTGGVSSRTLETALIVTTLVVVAAVFLISRRHHLK